MCTRAVSVRCLTTDERLKGIMAGLSILTQAPRLSEKKILLLEGGPKHSGDLKTHYSNRVSSLNSGTKSLMKSIGAWEHITNARYKSVKKMQVRRILAGIKRYAKWSTPSAVIVMRVWEACSDAMITFSYDNMCDDVAYIVENDVLLAAVNKQVEKLTENLTVLYQAKIKGCQLPQHSGTNEVRVDLENGSSYFCNLLVSNFFILLIDYFLWDLFLHFIFI
ncbi:hypothetical protein ANN_16754, partial [Periplaneta americana]